MTDEKEEESTQVQRSCMRDHIRNVIVTRILDNSYEPGMRLKELSLAREFNVSQAPVREALRELEALGLVESERYRGTRVRSADIEELKEAYELRAVLEERAAQLAVPCPPEALAILEKDLELMHESAARHDAKAYAERAVHFHRKIVELAGNRLLLRTWDSLHFEVRARIAAVKVESELLTYSKAHTTILDALRENHGVLAGRLLRELIERLLAAIEPGCEPSPPNRAKATSLTPTD